MLRGFIASRPSLPIFVADQCLPEIDCNLEKVVPCSAVVLLKIDCNLENVVSCSAVVLCEIRSNLEKVVSCSALNVAQVHDDDQVHATFGALPCFSDSAFQDCQQLVEHPPLPSSDHDEALDDWYADVGPLQGLVPTHVVVLCMPEIDSNLEER